MEKNINNKNGVQRKFLKVKDEIIQEQNYIITITKPAIISTSFLISDLWFSQEIQAK